MTSDVRTHLSFENFNLNYVSGELRRNDREIKLQPQPAKLLVLLATRKGEIVTRAEIQKALWGDDTFVDFEHGINFCIRQIRDALGDSAEKPRYLETVPRMGYRFIAAVETETASENDGKARSRWFAAAALALAVGLLAAALAWRSAKSDEMHPVTRPFTSFEGEEDMPSFSPDGDQIAYIWNGDGFFHVYVRLVAGGEPLQLTNAEADDLYPTWSPDGSIIAFLRDLWSYDEEGFEIRTVSALGGQERVLGRTPRETRPAWHPDGERLVIREAVSHPKGLTVLTLRTGERRMLTAPPDPRLYDQEARFSPDGKHLGFLRSVGAGGGFGEIFIQPLEGGEAKALTFRNRPIRGFDWTPDGNAIVFSSSGLETGDTELWKVAIAGGEPEPIRLAENALGLSVARKGHRLAYATRSGDLNVWRVSGPTASEPTPPRKHIASTRNEFLAEYSPDGKQIAFVSDREGDREIWICGASGDAPRSIAGPVVWGFPRWSRNGRSIAYSAATETGKTGIFVVDTRGGVVRALTSSEQGFIPDWSSDNAWVIFSSLKDGDWSVWKAPSSGGDAQPIAPAFAWRPIVFQDRVYFLRDFRVWSAPVEGAGEQSLILDRVVEFAQWTIWRGKIVYINRAEGRPSVEIYDPATGETRHVASLGENSHPGYGLSVSPDGAWILYTEDDGRSRRDIMLVENFDP